MTSPSSLHIRDGDEAAIVGRALAGSIILPERGLTLLPPWPQAIVFADKRLENRGATVAGHIGTWRGMVALTQSKKWDAKDAEDEAEYLALRCLCESGTLGGETDWRQTAGKLVAVAELMDVLPPDRCEGDPWHVPGQHGLILGQVWEVEPVPIIGGRGCWFAGQCPQCDTLQARDRIDGTCRRCGTRPVIGEDTRKPFDVTHAKLDAPDGASVDGYERSGGRWEPTPGHRWKRPALKIIRECIL